MALMYMLISASLSLLVHNLENVEITLGLVGVVCIASIDARCFILALWLSDRRVAFVLTLGAPP